MVNPIKQIYKYNHDADLLENGYDDFLESSFQIEEALEGFPNIELSKALWGKDSTDTDPKMLSREIVAHAQGEGFTSSLSDVDRLDKACDAVVFAIGSMTKLGLNPNQITRALNAVMEANYTKLGMPKDEKGKLTKPADFKGPEPKLQQILDER